MASANQQPLQQLQALAAVGTPASETEAAERLHIVLEAVRHLAETSNRVDDPPMVLLVSKQKSPEVISYYRKAGVRHFGENYVNELIDKASQLPKDIKWHFIGHLQSNKCKSLVEGCPSLYMIESVDSKKLATKLNSAVSGAGRSEELNILVQIKTSDEQSKTGLPADEHEVVEIVRHIYNECKSLKFSGLMTVGHSDVNKAAECFDKLRKLEHVLLEMITECERRFKDQRMILSMGMTQDIHIAIEKGSTELRLGSVLFGNRPFKEGKTA